MKVYRNLYTAHVSSSETPTLVLMPHLQFSCTSIALFLYSSLSAKSKVINYCSSAMINRVSGDFVRLFVVALKLLNYVLQMQQATNIQQNG